MNNSYDKFGLGLSIVLLLLYLHSFQDVEKQVVEGAVGAFNFSTNIWVAYTVGIFLTEVLVFWHLIFNQPGKLNSILLRTVGWLLILFGYGLYVYLNGGSGEWEILNKRGGGFNRF